MKQTEKEMLSGGILLTSLLVTTVGVMTYATKRYFKFQADHKREGEEILKGLKEGIEDYRRVNNIE